MKLTKIGHPAIDIDLAYATSNNIAGKRLYMDSDALLHPDAATALHAAADILQAQNLRICVFDAFRPAYVQQKLWAVLPDPEFIADPEVGSDHTRGIAVDLTITDQSGQPLDMATGFDEMVQQSHHNRVDIPVTAQQNRLLLLGAMALAGFQHNPFEWWHYSLPNAENYPLING
uniref:D-alanyl-D-alanine dipeptidase n=1 Tax=uncultured Thiotrichaceae bacterium TaxID=298394 RepID=A0A6S6TVU0_9GAMM|nr:MAG: D-alanyl-D-alanine dipeptidase [uncultured Thiotrichaceae bacterium]